MGPGHQASRPSVGWAQEGVHYSVLQGDVGGSHWWVQAFFLWWAPVRFEQVPGALFRNY